MNIFLFNTYAYSTWEKKKQFLNVIFIALCLKNIVAIIYNIEAD
jgi:hypothetical protein